MGLERDVCDQCGGQRARATSRWERLRWWFVYGRGMAHADVCRSCGAAWGGTSSGYVVLSGRSGWQRWSRMPGQVVAAVRRERTWEPVPRFYAIVGTAAATAAALAAVMTRARARWWWPPMSAAAAIGTGFALSAASAFRRGSAGRAVARVVAPRRAAEAERQAAAIRHNTSHLGVLVPADWHGSLAIRGTRWRGRGRDQQLTGFSVVADDPNIPGHGPRLEILHDLDDMPPVLAEEQAVAMVAGGESQRTMPDLARLHETGGHCPTPNLIGAAALSCFFSQRCSRDLGSRTPRRRMHDRERRPTPSPRQRGGRPRLSRAPDSPRRRRCARAGAEAQPDT